MVHDKADAGFAGVDREKPKPAVGSSHHLGQRAVNARFAFSPFKRGVNGELFQMAVGLFQAVLLAQQAGAPRAIQNVPGAHDPAIGQDHHAAGSVEVDFPDRCTGKHPAAAFRGVIKQHFVEYRAFNLIGSGLFAPKDVAKEETVLFGTAAGDDFTAVLDDHVDGFDLFFNAHALQCTQTARQQ
jgi:hypothetical protein